MQGDTPLPLPQKTVYYSAPMQIYMSVAIKGPALQAITVLFSPKAGKLDKIKAGKMLWDAFEATKGLPEPTKENTWHPNTHNLIDLRDWLWARCRLAPIRMGFIRRLMNFVIILYDFDPPWRWIFDSVREEAMRLEWKPRGFQDTWVEEHKLWWHEDASAGRDNDATVCGKND